MYRYIVTTLLAAILAIAAGTDLNSAPTPEPKVDPRICEAVQSQVDHIVSIANSASASDAEKVAKLKEKWAQSWEEIQKFVEDDPDLAGQLKQLGALVAELLFEADDPSNAGKKDISSQAKAALAQIKDRVKPYTTIMKMMCPQLVLPPAFSAQ
jgi:hypothetical protein